MGNQIYVFFAEDEKLLKACNRVWDEISNTMQEAYGSDMMKNIQRLK